MPLVEVYVPAYDQNYDIRMENQVPIGHLIKEMAMLIGQKEKNRLAGEIEKLCLCSIDLEQMLSPEQCLQDYGIGNGYRLILI